jgi:predicted Zn-dependent peptidase
MISYWSLSNGARLVVEEIPHVRSAAIGIYIGVGSRHEPEEMKGASHFIEHMLFKGTDDLTARAQSKQRLPGVLLWPWGSGIFSSALRCQS